MPKTIDIPKRGRYSYLQYHTKKDEYSFFEEMSFNRRDLREIWENKRESFVLETIIKPIYLKYENLFWKIFAIDWEVKEMLIVEEADETKIPNELPEEVVNFVMSIIEYNKKKLIFKHYKDD